MRMGWQGGNKTESGRMHPIRTTRSSSGQRGGKTHPQGQSGTDQDIRDNRDVGGCPPPKARPMLAGFAARGPFSRRHGYSAYVLTPAPKTWFPGFESFHIFAYGFDFSG